MNPAVAAHVPHHAHEVPMPALDLLIPTPSSWTGMLFRVKERAERTSPRRAFLSGDAQPTG